MSAVIDSVGEPGGPAAGLGIAVHAAAAGGPAARPLAAAAAATGPLRLDDLHLTLGALAMLLAWDLSGLDRLAMRLVGSASGFAWQDHWLTRFVLHDGGRMLGWACLALLAINVWRPLWAGPTRAERGRWLAVTMLCALAVPALKQFSRTSCPWDLAEFGGVAQYLSHWDAGTTLWGGPGDGGPGRCFPSGHATVAFAFFSGWFALRDHAPAWARRWLAGVVAVGVLFGLAQFARGAHHPSHTMWTAWLCWSICALLMRRRGPAWPRSRLVPRR